MEISSKKLKSGTADVFAKSSRTLQPNEVQFRTSIFLSKHDHSLHEKIKLRMFSVLFGDGVAITKFLDRLR